MRGEIEDTVRAAEMLADPFDPKELKFKPQMVKNNRALAMPYIDARVVQDRLDEVVGVDGWQDRYAIIPDGSVVCTLRVRLGGRWLVKTDVGSQSEQPDGGDRLKAAFSDALKRAAVKFGVGRYLYRLPAVWVDYDPVKKQLVQAPQLPAWALPGGYRMPPKPAAAAPAPKPPADPADPADEARRAIAAAATLADLGAVWERLPASVQLRVIGAKDRRKAELSRAMTEPDDYGFGGSDPANTIRH